MTAEQERAQRTKIAFCLRVLCSGLQWWWQQRIPPSHLLLLILPYGLVSSSSSSSSSDSLRFYRPSVAVGILWVHLTVHSLAATVRWETVGRSVGAISSMLFCPSSLPPSLQRSTAVRECAANSSSRTAVDHVVDDGRSSDGGCTVVQHASNVFQRVYWRSSGRTKDEGRRARIKQDRY